LIEAEKQRRLLLISFAAFLLHAGGETFTQQTCTRADEWLRAIDYVVAETMELLFEVSTAVRAAVKRDRIGYLDGLVKDVTVQDMRAPKALYTAVRRAFAGAKSARRSTFQPLPTVLLEDGQLAQSHADRVDRWAAFFGSQEAGVRVTADEYKQRFACPDIPVGNADPVFSIRAIPSLTELEQQLLRAQYGKACGPDGLTAEVFRLSAPHVAKLLFPICLKASLSLREPSEWRGGSLHCLAKKAQAALECSGYRSILMASVAGKAHHRILRNKLMPHFGAHRAALQFGQVAGVGVEAVAHIVRTYQVLMLGRRRVCATTFYDVKTAFYQVIRQALLPGTAGHTDARILELLHGWGVPEEALGELIIHLQNIAALPTACDDEHLCAQIADLFRGSWFRLDGADPLLVTYKGTRPGDPLADLLFGFLFSAYVKSSERALADAGLATHVPQAACGATTIFGHACQEIGCMAWADDFAHLQSALDVVALCEQVQRATSLLATRATAHGMQLTFAVDKSAVLFCSASSRAPNQYLTADPDGQLGLHIWDAILQRSFFLPVVDSYRHLGTIAVANARPGPEIAFRLSKAQATLIPLRRRLFSNSDIPLQTRCTPEGLVPRLCPHMARLMSVEGG
ncbi:unnamed protein product, partial [Symbiodinium necroappetens]